MRLQLPEAAMAASRFNHFYFSLYLPYPMAPVPLSRPNGKHMNIFRNARCIRASSKTGFLSLGTTDFQGCILLCGGGLSCVE